MLRVWLTQWGILLRLPSQEMGGTVRWGGVGGVQGERGADRSLSLGPPRRCRRAALMT